MIVVTLIFIQFAPIVTNLPTPTDTNIYKQYPVLIVSNTNVGIVIGVWSGDSMILP